MTREAAEKLLKDYTLAILKYDRERLAENAEQASALRDVLVAGLIGQRH